ncbi:hypothetical protein [Leptolyngbya sp. FACHB-16]|uniref:hypothetical protein n=1 Tax=unclassified Leptolyngbya TaxID=2650499 RepID=UPI001683E9C9|nr:hypothetical protein [Leptolyngbya sp. FACHB-16]MBD2156010.1 hypothetical protein [Leptolyngbya sp. FACHB-16]
MQFIYFANRLKGNQSYIFFMRLIGWIFLISAFISFLVFITNLIQGKVQGNLDDVMPLTATLALSGVFLGEASKAADKQAQNSKFLLEQSLLGIKYAIDLLSDRNNDRMTWISAARTLQNSLEIACGITEPEHKQIFEIEADRYRHQLWDILNPNDEEITAAFFYGAEDPKSDVDTAAKSSSLRRVGERFNMLSSVHALSEESLFVIWNFMSFPNNYEDPLKGIFSPEQIIKIDLHHQPLHDYLRHKRRYYSVAGELHDTHEMSQSFRPNFNPNKLGLPPLSPYSPDRNEESQEE